MDGPEVYRSDDEDMDPWEEKNKRQMCALVKKFRTYTQQKSLNLKRNSLTIPQPKLNSSQQRDRHAGLYSPDCTVTYSLSPHSSSMPSTSPWETVSKPRYESGSRSPIFDDEIHWGPVQDEDREVYDIVYGKEKRRGDRSSPCSRLESSDHIRHGDSDPFYSRLDSPVRKKHSDRSPLLSRHDSPGGQRHSSRDLFHSSLHSPSKKRNEDRQSFYSAPESSSSGKRYREVGHSKSDFSMGKNHGDKDSLYTRSDSPILKRSDDGYLFDRPHSPPSTRKRAKSPQYYRYERHSDKSPDYSKSESPTRIRCVDRSPPYTRTDFPCEKRSSDKSPCSNSSSSIGNRSRESRGIYNPSRMPTFPRDSDDGRYNRMPKDIFYPERRNPSNFEISEKLSSKRVDLSPMLSPPPPPVLSVNSTSPTFRPTDYSKPLPFKSSVSIEVEKSYNFLERLKKKQQILSKCELKIGELYRKRNKLISAPSLFYHQEKKSMSQSINVSPLISAQKIALTFNRSNSKQLESEDCQELTQDIIMSETLSDEHSYTSTAEMNLCLPQTIPSSIHQSTSSDQNILHPPYSLHSDNMSQVDPSHTNTSSHLSEHSNLYGTNVDYLNDQTIPSIVDSGVNPVFEMAYGPVRGSHPQEVNLNPGINYNTATTVDSSSSYLYGHEQYSSSWGSSQTNMGYGWPKYNTSFSSPSHHLSQHKLQSTPLVYPSNAYHEERPYQRPQIKSQITLNLLPKTNSYPATSTSSVDQTYEARVEQFLAKVQGPSGQHKIVNRKEKNDSLVLSSDDDDVIYVGKLSKNTSSGSRKSSGRESYVAESSNLKPPGISHSSGDLSSEPPPKKFHHKFSKTPNCNNIMVKLSKPVSININTTSKNDQNIKLLCGRDKYKKINRDLGSATNIVDTSDSGNTNIEENKLSQVKTMNDVSKESLEHKSLKLDSESVNKSNDHFDVGKKHSNKNLIDKETEMPSKVVPDSDVKLSHFDRVFYKGNPIARDIQEIQQRDVRLKKVYVNTLRKRTINKSLCIKNYLLCLEYEKIGTRIVASTVENEIIYYIHCLSAHVDDNLPHILKKYFTPIKELSERIKSALKLCNQCSKKNSFTDGSTSKGDENLSNKDFRISSSQSTIKESSVSTSISNKDFEFFNKKSENISYGRHDDVTQSSNQFDDDKMESKKLSVDCNSVTKFKPNLLGLTCTQNQLNRDGLIKGAIKDFSNSNECSGSKKEEDNLNKRLKTSEHEKIRQDSDIFSMKDETNQAKQRPPILAPGESYETKILSSTNETNPIRLVKDIQSKSKHILDVISKINHPNYKNVYFLKNRMLLKKFNIDGKSMVKILIPNDKIDEIIDIVHTKFSNHGSFANAMSILKKHFSPTPGLNQIVNNYIQSCSLCSNCKQ